MEVLGGTSQPRTVTIDGVRPTPFTWEDPFDWSAATDGIDAVYVVRPDHVDALELVGALLAETASRTRVVLLSEQDADYVAPDRWALRVEDAARSSRRPVSGVRRAP